MHVALGWIISQDTVDDNLDLAIGKPALGTEPCLCLDCRSRHEEDRSHTDGESHESLRSWLAIVQMIPYPHTYLDEEQPPPALETMSIVKMEDTEC